MKYKVHITEKTRFSVQVDAETPTEAVNKAVDIYAKEMWDGYSEIDVTGVTREADSA
jgi:hypothetical protein